MDRKVGHSPLCVSSACLMIAVAVVAASSVRRTAAAGPPADGADGPRLFAPPALSRAEQFPPEKAEVLLPRSMVPYLAERFRASTGRPAPTETPAEEEETTAAASDSGAAEAEPAAEPEAEPEPRSRPELTPEMAAFRDRVRRTILFYYGQPFNTESNTAADVLQFCTAFGCDAEIRAGGTGGKKVNAIGVLSWSYPCGGFRLLEHDGRRFVSRVGYGRQRSPGEFLAMLAMSQVPPDYEIRAGDKSGTVADLVRSEQLNCQSGIDQSFLLVGLAYYLPDGASWENELGKPWTLDRLIVEELDRKVDPAAPESVYRLMGLSAAADRGTADGIAFAGEWRRAAEYVRNFEKHAFKLQNADGTWHPRFFACQGTGNDSLDVLRSTGHITEWLAMSLADDQLQTRPMVAAVAQVNNLLVAQSSRKYIYALTPGEIEAIMHAVHALVIYDQRVFKPCDLVEPEPKEGVAAK